MIDDTLVGRAVGPYHLVRRLGGGGMASVYEGVHRHLHVARAVKIMSPALAAHDGFVRLFHREARLAISLDHPNIVKVYDVGADNAIHYIVMELLEGRSLRDVIRQDRPLSLARVAHFVRQLAEALEHAHSHGVAHRDVKPANAFVRPDDRLTLVDFGIARAADGTRLTMTHGIGTPEYMAPEIFDEELASDGVDEHHLATGADLYALGVVAYELLSGRLPFSGRTPQAIAFAHMHRPPQPLGQHLPDLPPEIEEIVLRQLSKRPADRIWPASAFADALTQAVGTTVEHGELREILTRGDIDRAERLVADLVAAGASDSLVAEARRMIDARRADLTRLPGFETIRPSVDRRLPAPPGPSASPRNGRVSTPAAPVAPVTERARPTTPAAPTRQMRRIASLVAVALVVVVFATAVAVSRPDVVLMLLPTSRAPTADRETVAAVTTASDPPTVLTPAAPQATSTSAPSPVTAPVAAQPASTSTVAPVTPTPVPATSTPSAAERLQVAQAAAFAGDHVRALALLDALASERPDTPGLEATLFKTHFDYGVVLRDRGEIDASLAQFDAALKVRPDDPTGLAAQRDALLLKDWNDMERAWGKDDDAAIAALDDIMQRQPDYRETRQKLYALLIARADRYLAVGDRDGAFPILMRALTVIPDGPEAHQRLATYTPTPTPLPPPPPTAMPVRPPQVQQPQAQPQAQPAAQPRPQPQPQPQAPASTPTKVPFRAPGG